MDAGGEVVDFGLMHGRLGERDRRGFAFGDELQRAVFDREIVRECGAFEHELEGVAECAAIQIPRGMQMHDRAAIVVPVGIDGERQAVVDVTGAVVSEAAEGSVVMAGVP